MRIGDLLETGFLGVGFIIIAPAILLMYLLDYILNVDIDFSIG